MIKSLQVTHAKSFQNLQAMRHYIRTSFINSQNFCFTVSLLEIGSPKASQPLCDETSMALKVVSDTVKMLNPRKCYQAK